MNKEPFSAADPDGPAYNAMIAKHKRLSAEQEAAQYEKIGKTADLTDKTLDSLSALRKPWARSLRMTNSSVLQRNTGS